jgi:arginine exporter protein ArgO
MQSTSGGFRPRALVASVIAIAVAAMTVWDVLIMMGVLGSSDAAFSRAKEVFQGLSGIFGTVLGLYFGAMAADSARREAIQSSLLTQRIRQTARDGIRRALSQEATIVGSAAENSMVRELARTLAALDEPP